MVFGGRPETECKPVDVIARHHANGAVTPIRVFWPDGRRYEIRVVEQKREFDRERHMSVTDYTVDVTIPNKPSRRTHIWCDGQIWWVEAKAR